MTCEERKALVDFLLDIDCLKALDGKGKNVNIFDVLKISNTEIRHSNILAWLFDPNESHMLGDCFIKSFVSRVVNRYSGDIDPFNILLQDFFSYDVYREANYMDIVLHSKKERTAIIIENKIWSSEGKNQLNDYRERSKQIYSDCDKLLYVFLTPAGQDASDLENWISLSYRDIAEILDMILKRDIPSQEVKLIITNYADMIRRNIMNERDEELYTLCNEIYNKHKTALRLIFDNVKIDNSLDTEIIGGVLSDFAKEGKIVYQPEYRLKFFTSEMSEFLPDLPERKSSWRTNYIYYFWFEKTADSLIIHFEVGGDNVGENEKKKMEALLSACFDGKKKKKTELGIFNRIYKGKLKLDENDYEKSLRDAATKLINDVLKWEKDILVKAKDILEKA